MEVAFVPCAPAANESEREAFKRICERLRSSPGTDKWILLANLAFALNEERQPDEIDLLCIGPPGVAVIEIKHWTAAWVGDHRREVDQEADRLVGKTRKVATTLRRHCPRLPRVDPVFLLTQEKARVEGLRGREKRGVRFFHLSDWQDALAFHAQSVLGRDDVERLARLIEPRAKASLDGDIRTVAGYVNLERQTPSEERFHRVYKGLHQRRRDRALLHLYDLSADPSRRAEEKARREFEALQRLQQYSWAPRILDSFQPVPGYIGEMFFFTVLDPSAPALEERAADPHWSTAGRIAFAHAAFAALRELHGERGQPLHRCLTARTILVRHDDRPVFTGFHLARVPAEDTIAADTPLPAACIGTAAPEVRANGLAAATPASDVYSLCSALRLLFRNETEDIARRAEEILDRGEQEDPTARPSAEQLEREFAALAGEGHEPEVPPARFWCEDQIVRFHQRSYRIVARLGSGGVGTTFKVVEVDASGEELGTYVGKVVGQPELGPALLRAYRLARPHLGAQRALATIFEVAPEWRENAFVALLKWIEGSPLGEFTGVFPLLAEDLGESPAALARRWLREVCEALDELHRAGLVHGDVSPKNLIVAGSSLVLTDYDSVSRAGEAAKLPGTLLYCSPSRVKGLPAYPADDYYALAASFFHVLFERPPFAYQDGEHKERGLNWGEIARDEWSGLAPFLDKATDPDPAKRIGSLSEALSLLAETSEDSALAAAPPLAAEAPGPFVVATRGTLSPQRIEWLELLLQSYPGSRWGNQETRGLDSDFAAATFVETRLERTLSEQVEGGPPCLVILCGNAGDGKTALLQHLAERIGVGRHLSSQRMFEGRLLSGRLVRINLDGSAAWQGHSSDELLHDFLAPFQSGPPTDDRVHLLAINDGRLLEWIEQFEDQQGPTALTTSLRARLQGEEANGDVPLSFINLNARSLVGNVLASEGRIDTSFLERLLDRLYGGEQAGEIWAPCGQCSAKTACEVFRATRLFGPTGVPEERGEEARAWARQRLFAALQAVHVRGETHITMRELRAALVYILFGIHYCDEYHEGRPFGARPYWDRAFAADAPGRQGEVLRELVRFDPALEASPRLDRHLIPDPVWGSSAVQDPAALASARRQAYFEWTAANFAQIGESPAALQLANGAYLQSFVQFPLETDEAKRRALRDRVCRGVSQLEDLPVIASSRPGVVPLRVMPRTPTETVFWVEKPLDSFSLEVPLLEAEGMDQFHRELFLVYRYRDGRQERLRLGADLFHHLLELADGYQLGDVSSDETFAQLAIFVQRLRREDESCLYAWNPMREDIVYKISTRLEEGEEGPVQRLVLEPLGGEGA